MALQVPTENLLISSEIHSHRKRHSMAYKCYIIEFFISGLLKMHGKPKVKPATTNKEILNIIWLKPNHNDLPNETVNYDIRCYVCDSNSVCNKSCTGVKFEPGQSNITKTYVLVSGLKDDETYQFKVFPKNSLNNIVAQDKWNSSASELYTFQPKGNIFLSLVPIFFL